MNKLNKVKEKTVIPGIPNVLGITDQIVQILEFMSQDDMIELRKTNKDAFINKVDEKFPYFATKHFKLMYILYDDNMDQINHLLKMLSMLHQGNMNGDDISVIHSKMINDIDKEFLTSEHNSSKKKKKKKKK